MIGHCFMREGQISKALLRWFSRATKPSKGSFKEKIESRFKVTPQTDKRLLDEEDRLKPDDPELSEKTLAKMHLKTQIMPEK